MHMLTRFIESQSTPSPIMKLFLILKSSVVSLINNFVSCNSFGLLLTDKLLHYKDESVSYDNYLKRYTLNNLNNTYKKQN